MPTGLTYDEYLELKIDTRTCSDPMTQTLQKPADDLVFPMTPAEVVNHVRSRGYCCRTAALEFLTKSQVIRPGRDGWQRVDVEAVCQHLEKHWLFTPYVELCRVLGCRYASFLRALNASAQLATEKYGIQVRADDQLFVMHRTPARDGNEAIISFELCDDIREMLERGEAV